MSDEIPQHSAEGGGALETPPPARGGRCFAAIAATFPIGAAIVGCLWRPDFATALTLVPPWLWLVSGFGSLLVGCRKRSRRAGWGVVVLWIAFALGYVEEVRSVPRLAESAPGAADGERVRIVSLNAAGSAGCAADLRLVRPDIVLLQESVGGEHLLRLAREVFGDEAGVLDGGDTALLARGPIEPRFVDRRGHYVIGVVSLAGVGELCCASLRLDPPPSRFDAWSSGFWKDHSRLRATHRRQLQEVVDRLREVSRNEPLVVGGDFNTVPLDRALDVLRPGLSDAFVRRGRGWGATGTNALPLFRVDQIWTGRRVVPLEVRAKPTTGSDHRMVICDLRVR